MSLKGLKNEPLDPVDGESARVARVGAARDGVEVRDGASVLPRILRYACLPNPRETAQRVAADVAVLAPALSGEANVWAATVDQRDWSPLAEALDSAAVHLDQPALRGLADVVRLLSMTTGEVVTKRGDALRVLAALEVADDLCVDWLRDARPQLADVDIIRIGWGRLIVSQLDPSLDRTLHACEVAYRKGEAICRNIVALAEDETRTAVEGKATLPSSNVAVLGHATEPAFVGCAEGDAKVICGLQALASGRGNEVFRAYEHAVGRALPLVVAPDLAEVRRQLSAEYPYAADQVERILGPLIGRRHVTIMPTILVGPPGSGKSRFVRRLAESLGVACWRVDGARSDNSSFGGCDRRWHTTEPCHPFLAIARAGEANPLVLVDEIDKAATRSDHGRLWDALLPFLERETSSAYPDPCLQSDLDLSAVSYVMTANSVAALPTALVDRCCVLQFPEPRARHMPALLVSLMNLHAEEAGLDPRWIEPLSGDEAAVLSRRWRGGSVRQLRTLLDVVLRGRDRLRLRH